MTTIHRINCSRIGISTLVSLIDFFHCVYYLSEQVFCFDYLAVAIATIVILLVITGIVILIKYLIRTHRRRTLRSLAKVKFFFFSSSLRKNSFFF